MIINEAPLQLQFFGRFRAVRSGQSELPRPQRKVIGLLAFLALEAGRAHSRETVMGLLWPELPEAKARNNLRVSLARLREWLGIVALPASSLKSTRTDIQFQLSEAVTTDVAAFQTRLAATESHVHSSRAHCADCQEWLSVAVENYRGPLLEGFFLSDCPAFEEWLFVWRERHHLQVMDVLEELADGLMEAGDFAEATVYTRRQLELDPLHDGAQQRLLRLLAYQGQHNAALAQYQVYENLMEDELGLAPDVALVQLVQQIRQRALPLPDDISPSVDRRHNLPENLTPFVGRETELSQLAERLANPAYRLITLAGPGGIGKTRLAVEAARTHLHHFADGAYFVPLAGVASAYDVPAAIVEAIGLSFSGSEPPAQQIVRLLSNKNVLLIVDNLEHLMGSAPLLLDIVKKAPDVVLLVTSRERLNLEIEDLFRLEGLPYPTDTHDKTAGGYAAVRLFADRAHRLNKQFSLHGETLQHVVRICQVVEGLPLGLELAATWSRDLGVGELADALTGNADLLQTDLRDVDPRHQSIHTVFDFSWRLLSAREQVILPLLTLFRGSFSGQAAAEIMGADALTLTQLRYKSLIRGAGARRYSLHELLRQMAAGKLTARSDGYQARFSDYYFRWLRREAPQLRKLEAHATATAFERDADNIRQAWQWALQSDEFGALQETVPSLVRFYAHSGWYTEGMGLIDDVLRRLPEAEQWRRPYFLVEKSFLLAIAYAGQLGRQQPLIEELLTLTAGVPHLKSIRARAFAYYSEALFIDSIDSARSRDYAERAMNLARQLGDQELIAQLHLQLGKLHYRFEDTEASVSEIGKALAIYESSADVRGVADSYYLLSIAYAESGDELKSMAYNEKLLELYPQLGLELKTADAYRSRSISYSAFGNAAQAQALLAKALAVYRKFNDEASIQKVYSAMGENEFFLGNDQQSLAYYREAIRLQDKLQMKSRLCNDLTSYSMPLRRAGHLDQAQAVLERAIRVSVAPRYKIQAEAHLAVVLLEKGAREEAHRLVSELWETIRVDQAQSLPAPLMTLEHLFRVFIAVEAEQEAREVLLLAKRKITETAAQIPDPALLEGFLNRQQEVLFFRPQFVAFGLSSIG